MYLMEDVWVIVKEFMLDWKNGWNKKMKVVLEEGIKCHYPQRLVGERYDIKTKLYYTTFTSDRKMLGNRIKGQGEERGEEQGEEQGEERVLELRVSNNYSASENQWLESFYLGGFLTLS
jgi:hypothetical protein